MNITNRLRQLMFKTNKFFMQKNRLVIMAMVIVILFFGGASGWMYIANQKSTSKKAATPVLKGNELVNKTQDDTQKIVNYGGDIDKAATIYDQAASSADDDKTKSALLLEKAMMYFNDGNYDQALISAQESDAILKTENVAKIIALIYEVKGDTKNAIYYYQNAISLVDESQPMADANIKNYQTKIDTLSGVK